LRQEYGAVQEQEKDDARQTLYHGSLRSYLMFCLTPTPSCERVDAVAVILMPSVPTPNAVIDCHSRLLLRTLSSISVRSAGTYQLILGLFVLP
jgi:hypothetical protein